MYITFICYTCVCTHYTMYMRRTRKHFYNEHTNPGRETLNARQILKRATVFHGVASVKFRYETSVLLVRPWFPSCGGSPAHVPVHVAPSAAFDHVMRRHPDACPNANVKIIATASRVERWLGQPAM